MSIDPIKCGFFDDHDEDGEPRGNQCVEMPVHEIFWRDGQRSLGCPEHLREVRRNVPHLIARVTDYRSPILN